MAQARRRLGEARLGGPGYATVDRTLATIARHRMFEGGGTVVVAFSGGPDSTCLLDVLARVQEKLDLSLVVAHVDHGSSEESGKVAARVSHEAAASGFEVHLARAPDLSGSNMQARAREFRYEFFDIVARRESASWVATGHTLDDRVETTRARLIHGAGPAGLAGLSPVESTRVRPLIDLRRSETRAYCEECALDFYDDPANNDSRFERNVVRAELVETIERIWGPGAVRAIATSSARLREDADALAALASGVFGQISSGAGDSISLRRDRLTELPRAFRRRVLEVAVGRVRDRSAGIDEVLDILDRDPPAKTRVAIAGGRDVVIDKDEVVVKGSESVD